MTEQDKIEPGSILALLGNSLEINFRQMKWADEEIEKARQLYGESEPLGPLFRSFPLMACIGQPYMALEPVFRAHCREICKRVATGQDTKPGTDAEIFGVLVQASLMLPLTPHLVTLYFRLARTLLPEHFKVFTNAMGEPDLASYEKIHGSRADEEYAHMRRKLTRDRRRAGAVALGKGDEFPEDDHGDTPEA